MKKPMMTMLIALGILFGGIFLYKMVMGLLLKHYFATHQNPVVTVSSMKVNYSSWESSLKSVGSARALNGVNVTTELAGMVEDIYFTPGTVVKKGTVLVQ